MCKEHRDGSNTGKRSLERAGRPRILVAAVMNGDGMTVVGGGVGDDTRGAWLGSRHMRVLKPRAMTYDILYWKLHQHSPWPRSALLYTVWPVA